MSADIAGASDSEINYTSCAPTSTMRTKGLHAVKLWWRSPFCAHVRSCVALELGFSPVPKFQFEILNRIAR